MILLSQSWTKKIIFVSPMTFSGINDIMIVWTRPVSNYCFCYSNNYDYDRKTINYTITD